MPIENYRDELAPLMSSFAVDPLLALYRNRDYCSFTDQFGNKMELDGNGDVLGLLKNPEMKIIELETDSGYESMSLYQHQGDYFILFRTKVNLNSGYGWFTSFVVVPTLDDIIAKMETYQLKQNGSLENC